MCGIYAVIGKTNTAGIEVLQGLKNLEYRGYDSWGIAYRDSVKDKIIITKDIGKISEVEEEFPESNLAIGHTRWATHGAVTKENAHPQKVGKVTIVHNGIFENYKEYKQIFSYKSSDLENTNEKQISLNLELPSENNAEYCTFISETDTEVIAAMINGFLENNDDPQKAIEKTARRIKGRFAILVLIDGVEGIFVTRRGSPIIIGRDKNKTHIASDISAFLSETNVVNYVDDNELAYVTSDKINFFNLKTGEQIKKRNIIVPWKVEETTKGKFPHFMIKEIFDQKETIAVSINQKQEKLKQAIDWIHESNGMYLIACGTAHKMACAGEYFFAQISGRKVNVVPASEMEHFLRFINKKTLLMAISQSGETADVLEVLTKGKQQGAKIISLTNIESSSIARMADLNIPLNIGLEKAVASTKATTAQLALLFLLAYADQGQINIGREILRSVAGNINDWLNPRYEERVRSVAEKIVNQPNLFIIGRGTLYPMALESAIKILEVSYIHAQGFAAGELKHGPLALIEKNVPCLVLGNDPATLSNAQEIQSRGANIIGISSSREDVFDEWLKVPDCGAAQSIATIIPVQILAYHLGVLRGNNPDMPRNLAKSVTVN